MTRNCRDERHVTCMYAFSISVNTPISTWQSARFVSGRHIHNAQPLSSTSAHARRATRVQEAAAKARLEMVGVDDEDDGSTRVGKGSKKRRVKGAEGAPGKAPDGAHVSLKAMMEAGPASIPLPSAAAGAACVTAEVEARGRQVLDGANVADAAQASVLVSHQQVRERDGTAAKHGGKRPGEGSPDRREKGKKDGRKGRDKKRNKVKKKEKGVKEAVEQRRFKQDEQEHHGLHKKERNAKERREGGGAGHMEGDEALCWE